jgi:hypothetical protein
MLGQFPPSWESAAYAIVVVESAKPTDATRMERRREVVRCKADESERNEESVNVHLYHQARQALNRSENLDALSPTRAER